MAMLLKLKRIDKSEKGTFGALSLDGENLCLTCEDPWTDNERNISCIPEGLYQCQKFNGVRFKDVWEVKNVPDRSAILIHSGNTIDDTHGCILVGDSIGIVNDKPGVLNSKKTLDKLRARLPNSFTLEITSV